MFASTKQMGTCTAMPDVCITPVPPPVSQAPVPYPNLGNCPLANDTASKVFLAGSLALTTKSNTTTSNSNEAGVKGGVVSGKNVGKVEYLAGSVCVKVEGSPAVRLSSATKQNENNMVGAQLVPSQTTVMILT